MHKIFIRNKYTKWYFSIIKKAKNRIVDSTIYYENHHIFPASLFPKYKNLKRYVWNGVLLTAKEHYIVHCLLIKMTTGKNKRKMLFALNSMKMKRSEIPRYTSRLFEYFRKDIAESISKNNKGKLKGIKLGTRSEDHKKNLSLSLKNSEKAQKARIENSKKGADKTRGVPRPEHLKKQWSEKAKGIPKSEEAKQNMSLAKKGKKFGPRLQYRQDTCPHCGKTGGSNTMKRWHFDNCKFISAPY